MSPKNLYNDYDNKMFGVRNSSGTISFIDKEDYASEVYPDRSGFKPFSIRSKAKDPAQLAVQISGRGEGDSALPSYLHIKFKPASASGKSDARNERFNAKVLSQFLPKSLLDSSIPLRKQSFFINSASPEMTASTMLHFDTDEGFIFQVKGRKRIYFVSPEEGAEHFLPYPPVSPYFRQSKLGQVLATLPRSQMKGLEKDVPAMTHLKEVVIGPGTWSQIYASPPVAPLCPCDAV